MEKVIEDILDNYINTRSPNTCEGNVFCPFDTFSGTTVIFENVETSKLYHYCNIKNVVAKIA